jgi:hypothetical protein
MSRGWPGDSVVLQSETIAQACPDDFKDDLLPEERDELLRAQLMSERDVRVEAHAATEPSTADRFFAARRSFALAHARCNIAFFRTGG